MSTSVVPALTTPGNCSRGMSPSLGEPYFLCHNPELRVVFSFVFRGMKDLRLMPSGRRAADLENFDA